MISSIFYIESSVMHLNNDSQIMFFKGICLSSSIQLFCI